MTNARVTVRPRERLELKGERPRRVLHTVHLRELEMADGRKLLIDRRCIAFLCEGKQEALGGKR